MASFWIELRRRNVFRVAIAYSAAVWALLQVADLVLSNLGAPAWIIQMLIVAAAIGFPIALILAWLFDITPDGIKAAADVPADSERRFSTRQINYAIIALLIVAISFLVVDNYVRTDAPLESSIAVLPFTSASTSGDDGTDVFALGMQDTILTQLAKIGGIKVISRTSVLEFANRGLSAPEIADELGVATVLEATVLQSGDQLVVNVQLIDGETDGHLWAERFERELTAANFFAVQRELATSIAGILQVTLTPAEQAALARVPTQNERALRLYLTGNEFARRPDERESMPDAIAFYEQAVAEDPGFLEAWAALAEAHVQLYGMVGEERTDSRALKASEALLKARELDSDSPEVHRAAGMYATFVRQDIDAAIAENEIALLGLPGSADVLNALARAYRRAGNYEQSLAYGLRARELDPRNVDALVSLGPGTYARLRDYDKAVEVLDAALEIAPSEVQLHWARAMVSLWRDGDVDPMRALLADPPAGVDLGRYRVIASVLIGRYEREPEFALETLEALPPQNRPPRIISERNRLLWLAQLYQLAGRQEQAVDHFEQLLQHSEDALIKDPDDARFQLYRGAALVGLGRMDEGVAAARTALESARDFANSDAVEFVLEDAATQVFGPAGEVDLTVETLTALLSTQGAFSIEGLSRDPGLDLVKNDPKFLALYERFARDPKGADQTGSATVP